MGLRGSKPRRQLTFNTAWCDARKITESTARGTALPDEWKLGEQEPSLRAGLLSVAHTPPAVQHSSHFIAKKNEFEANGFARMRAAAAYHGVDMTRQQHVIQPAELTSQVVILPRFDMDLYSATMGRHITQHDAVGIVRDVVRGVAVLGECALAHIDLAPTNVCVHKNGRTWHGVIIDMETVQYVPGRLPALWVDKPPPRLHFASLARHARGDNWTDPAHGSIDIVDELESCGWILCWALCMLQGVAFLSFPRPPGDPGGGWVWLSPSE